MTDTVKWIEGMLRATHRVMYKGKELAPKLGHNIGTLQECINYIREQEAELDRYSQHSPYTIEKVKS